MADDELVACPDDGCDGTLILLSTHEKEVRVGLDKTGWSVRSVPTGHRIRVGCATCGSVVIRSDAAETSPEALSLVLGMMKRGQLVAYEERETADAG